MSTEARKLADKSVRLDLSVIVPLPDFLADELAIYLQGRQLDDLVFTAPAGGPLPNSNFRRDAFDPATESVGLKGLRPHDLRHTAASLAVSAGANVKAVQQMLGHASAAMTLDVYAGLFSDDLAAVARSLHAAVTARDVVAMRSPDQPCADVSPPEESEHGR